MKKDDAIQNEQVAMRKRNESLNATPPLRSFVFICRQWADRRNRGRKEENGKEEKRREKEKIAS